MINVYRNFTSAFDLQLFAAGDVVNATTGYVNSATGAVENFAGRNDLSPQMKTYYDTELLENSRSEYYFAQFARKQGLPANRGRTIEWRKWNTLPNAKVLQEGVVPTGEKLGQTVINTGLTQLGMFVAITDILDLHAIDNVLLGATEELGASAGDTQDKLMRNTAMTGTSVMYCATTDENGKVTGYPESRYEMNADNNKLTPEMVNRAVTILKKQKAPKINGKYVAIIHPSVAEDLRESKGWIEAHKYASPEEIFNGEIGELHGVRFIESPNAKVDVGAPLAEGKVFLTVSAYSATDSTTTVAHGEPSQYKVTVSDSITDEDAKALVGRMVHIMDGSEFVATIEICGASTSGIWLMSAPPAALANGDKLYPGEGGNPTNGQANVAVYSTLFLGKDAYGMIDPDGGSLEMIVKDKKQIGGPLEQFSTAGYKFEHGSVILYEERMLRVESCSSYSLLDEAN